MTASAERQMARRNTRAFIDADPCKILVKRSAMEQTEAGGRRALPPVTLAVQTVRLVPLSGNVWDRSKMTTDEGNLPDVTHQVIGMPSLNIEKDDIFVSTDNEGRKTEWLVSHVSPERGNRTSGYVVVRDQKAQ